MANQSYVTTVLEMSLQIRALAFCELCWLSDGRVMRLAGDTLDKSGSVFCKLYWFRSVRIHHIEKCKISPIVNRNKLPQSYSFVKS